MSKARQLAQKPSQPTGRKNLIINGAQVIDQRNSGSSVTITSNDTFITDRFAAAMPSNGGSKMSVQQVSEAPEDFEYSLKVTSLTADTVAAGDFYAINQWIEGQNCSFLNWGSSNAKTVTLSFYVRSSLTGTFGGALQNSDRTRAYPFTYTISSANTWERKTITISGDTSGTWLTSNGRGIGVVWGISVGSTYLGTAGAWVGANIWSVSSATSVLETDAATWQITGVQFEVGSTATEFEHRSYGEELQLCRRYYQKYIFKQYTAIATVANWNGHSSYGAFHFDVTMRAAPTTFDDNGASNFRRYQAGTDDAPTNMYLQTPSPTGCEVSYNHASDTTGQAGWLRSFNNAASFEFDSEL